MISQDAGFITFDIQWCSSHGGGLPCTCNRFICASASSHPGSLLSLKIPKPGVKAGVGWCRFLVYTIFASRESRFHFQTILFSPYLLSDNQFRFSSRVQHRFSTWNSTLRASSLISQHRNPHCRLICLIYNIDIKFTISTLFWGNLGL